MFETFKYKVNKIKQTFLTPSSFEDDIEGAGGNQLSHICMGVWFSCIVSLLVYQFQGIMPYKWMVILLGVSFYFIIIEMWKQGWQGWDTLIDTYFFALGALFPIKTLTEVQALSGEYYLSVNTWWFIVLSIISILSLFIYVYERVK